MKKFITLLMVACATVSCIKEGTPTTSGNYKQYQISGKVTQNGNAAAAPTGQCKVLLYREPYFKEVVAESLTDPQGYYSLDFSTNLNHEEYFVELTQPIPLYLQGYYPHFEPIPVQPGAGQKLDLVLPTYAVLLASFRKRGTNSVSNVSIRMGSLVIPISINPPLDRHFLLQGNVNTDISFSYRVDGIQYTDSISFYVTPYDTINQVFEYGLP